MKIARLLSISFAGLFVITTRAGADPSDSSSSDSSDSSTVAPNPYMQVDPDGVPLSISQPGTRELTPAEIASIKQEARRAAVNKDWLLRGYERQLQAHAATATGLTDNLYYQLSTNKELAKLAGMPALDDDDQAGSTSTKAGASSSGTARSDTSTSAPNKFAPDFLSSPSSGPLGAPTSSGMHSLYSALPFAMPSPMAGNYLPAQFQVAGSPSATADQSPESSDLSMPGMVAAKSDPSTLTDPTDSTLDILPDESIEHAREHQDNSAALLELPVAMDADQLHKNQAAALNPVAAANSLPQAAKAPPPAVNVNPKPIENPEAPMPLDKQPTINPVRAPIANPYDILNR